MSKLALELIAKEKEAKTGRLDLGNCNLYGLPSKLFELEHLKVLILSDAQWDNQNQKWKDNSSNRGGINRFSGKLPEGIGKLKNLEAIYLDGVKRNNSGHLDVNENWNITNISALRELPAIRFINASYNQIEDISSLTNLISLESLNLRDNKIENISSLTNLTSLESLNLRDNKIENISSLTNLTSLESLNLRGNKIEDISSLVNLNTLKNLNLWSNQIENISSLANLITLQSLSLSFNQIEDISSLANLTALQSLSLSSNKIKDISSLANLTALQHLSLSSNKIKNISSLVNLIALQILDLSFNKIKDISSLVNLIALQDIDLWNNKIKDISSLANLTALQHLNLRNNETEDISSLANFTTLQSLSLSSNKIIEIEGLLPLIRLKKMALSFERYDWREKINLYGNPIRNPPLEIAQQGNQAVIDYFDSLKGLKEEEKKPIREIKILLIGEGMAGKTSLLKRIKGLDFDGDESQTHGIIIETLPLDALPVLQDFPAINDITGRFWDFGGQEIMHASHQFFLTQRSVYILVSDSRTEPKVEYWLQHIEKYGGEQAAVFLAVNKIDDNRNHDVERRHLNKKYPFLQNRFHRISCKTGEGIAALLTDIAGILPQNEILNTPISIYWHRIKEALEEATAEQHYIDQAAFEAICVEHGVLKSSEQHTLLRFLNDLGIVLHFEQLDMKNFFVLDPHWATIGVYKIINSQAIEGGILKESQLEYILNEEVVKTHEYDPAKDKVLHYKATEQAYLLKIMEQFELLYRYAPKAYLIPDLLPKEAKGELSVNHQEGEHIHFVLEYDFLPTSIISRFIIRMKADIHDLQQLWRTGLVLGHCQTGAMALVRSDREQKRIYICVSGSFKEKRAYFAVIHHTIWSINDEFEALEVKELMPLSGHPSIELDYRDLLRREKNGRDEYYVSELDKDFSVSKDFLDKINTRMERMESRQRHRGFASKQEHYASGDNVGENKTVNNYYYANPPMETPRQPRQEPPKPKIPNPNAKNILLLTANPKGSDSLRLDQEVRQIEKSMARASHRDDFVVVSKWAVQITDMRRALLDKKPFIVQFSGHGSKAGELVVENRQGEPQTIPPKALGNFFKTIQKRSPIHCVVLNACYSEIQAKEILEAKIPFVIGMSDAIPDEAAMVFSEAFYDSIGTGDDVDLAFEIGVDAIGMNGMLGGEIPVLLTGVGDS